MMLFFFSSPTQVVCIQLVHFVYFVDQQNRQCIRTHRSLRASHDLYSSYLSHHTSQSSFLTLQRNQSCTLRTSKFKQASFVVPIVLKLLDSLFPHNLGILAVCILCKSGAGEQIAILGSYLLRNIICYISPCISLSWFSLQFRRRFSVYGRRSMRS